MNLNSMFCFLILEAHYSVRMSIRQRSKGLQDLLAELARFFRANETTISAEQVSKCLEHLPAIESSALDRLFILLHQTKSVYPLGQSSFACQR